MIELLRIQALSISFTKTDIITGLVYEYMTIKAMVIHTHDGKNTLLVFPESADIKNYVTHCNLLRCGWVTV